MNQLLIIHLCIMPPQFDVFLGFKLSSSREISTTKRFEPSSRTTLTGEQPDAWDLLQPHAVMSRHRGAEPCRPCGL
jgi:hypothetical protein